MGLHILFLVILAGAAAALTLFAMSWLPPAAQAIFALAACVLALLIRLRR